MGKDGMSKDTMSKDGMKKDDAMSKDGMKKEAMSKDGMKKDDAMLKDGMKKTTAGLGYPASGPFKISGLMPIKRGRELIQSISRRRTSIQFLMKRTPT